ncbi:inositol monophosphatase family protein [Kitasatospora phosalacinea]|nr:inositol monophosphatase family protein [Kitasatospora phosalacinea]
MDDDLDLAVRAALAGARVGLEHFARVAALPVEAKADGSPVTEADLAVERTVRRALSAERPDDAHLGEETGALGTGPRRWLLDGIDGTLVFVRGDDRWQSLVALEQDGEVTVGVAVVPARHRIWYAAKGRGAYTAGIGPDGLADARPLRVRGPGRGRPRVGLLPPVELLPEHRRDELRPVAERYAVADWSVHAALLVAEGVLDAAVQLGGALWDHAPLGLILTEAGGAFADPRGKGHPVVGTAVYARDEALRAELGGLLLGTGRAAEGPVGVPAGLRVPGVGDGAPGDRDESTSG